MGGGIEVQGLDFAYRGTEVFADFHFATLGARTLIRGPSGCGKTTLIKLIAGILTPRGSATITRPAPIFTVLQSDGLVPWLSGHENIALFSEELWVRVARGPLFWLIEPFAERRACDMSFGQRRSIEIICALESGRLLLLLDEPLSFLDRDRRSALLAFINDESRFKSQLVMTSHYEDATSLPGADVFEFRGDPPYQQLVRAS